ncbi:unnamed protein product, partial [Staurois parvus]
TNQQKELKTSALSCDQLCPRRAGNRHSSEGTSTLIIRALMISALMISVDPSVPSVSVHQCHLPVPISATSMPHISAFQCTSMSHISAHLSCLSVPPISATYQYCQSVPPINVSQHRLSVPVSATYQCASV